MLGYGATRKRKMYAATEAYRSLSAIETLASQRFGEGIPGPDGARIHAFCPSAPRTPATAPRAEMLHAPADAWRAEGWSCLGFTLPAPQRYSLSYTSNYPATGSAASFTIEANGDLDGDGVTSTFRLTAQGTKSGDLERIRHEVTNEYE